MIELLLPKTDAGALVQAVGAALLFSAAAFAVRRNRDLVLFVAGLASVTAAWFGLRTLH